MVALNNIELSEELKEYWKFRMTALTLSDQVTQEDYGLAIPEGKEKIIPLDWQKSKRKESVKIKLIQGSEQTHSEDPVKQQMKLL